MNKWMNSRQQTLPSHSAGYKKALSDCADCDLEGEASYDHLMDGSKSFLDRVNTAVAESPMSNAGSAAVIATSVLGAGLLLYFSARPPKKDPLSDGGKQRRSKRRNGSKRSKS